MGKIILAFLLLLSLGLFISGCSNTDQTEETAMIETGASQEPNKEVLCAKGIENDPYPGSCGKYVDENNNRICDLSE